MKYSLFLESAYITSFICIYVSTVNLISRKYPYPVIPMRSKNHIQVEGNLIFVFILFF